MEVENAFQNIIYNIHKSNLNLKIEISHLSANENHTEFHYEPLNKLEKGDMIGRYSAGSQCSHQTETVHLGYNCLVQSYWRHMEQLWPWGKHKESVY